MMAARDMKLFEPDDTLSDMKLPTLAEAHLAKHDARRLGATGCRAADLAHAVQSGLYLSKTAVPALLVHPDSLSCPMSLAKELGSSVGQTQQEERLLRQTFSQPIQTRSQFFKDVWSQAAASKQSTLCLGVLLG